MTAMLIKGTGGGGVGESPLRARFKKEIITISLYLDSALPMR